MVASRMVRPGQVYKVAVTVYKAKQPISVRASIQRNGVELASDTSLIKEGIQETLLLLVRINIRLLFQISEENTICYIYVATFRFQLQVLLAIIN